MQSLIGRYSGQQFYQGIPHIHDVRPYAEDRDGRVMREMFRIIRGAEMGRLVGVALLHRHYDLDDGEVWYESAAGNRIVSVPTAYTALLGGFHPMVYRLTPDSAVPMHWRAGTDPHADKVSAFLESATPRLLAILGEDSRRFGLIRVPPYAEFSRGKRLRESSVSTSRALVSEWHDALGETDAIPTTWFARARKGGATVATLCYPFSECIVDAKGKHSVVHAHDKAE